MTAGADLLQSIRDARPSLRQDAGPHLNGDNLADMLERLAAQFARPGRRLVIDPGGIDGALVILASVFSAPTAVIPSGNPDLRAIVIERHRPDVVLDEQATVDLARRVVENAASPNAIASPNIASPKTFDVDEGQLLLPTSGTTGEPKLVVLQASQLLHSARAVGTSLALTPADTTIAVMPLSHVHGLVASVIAPLLAGGTVVVADGFSAARATASIDEHGANWISAVPSILQLLLQQSLRNGWLPARPFRFLRSASAALPPSLLERLEDRFSCPVLEAYGMTEAAHEISSNRRENRTPGSVGWASGCAVTVLNQRSTPGSTALGELAIRGPQVTSGYLGMPTRADDEWLRTGDLGWIDDEGRIWIHGRSKEVINRSGETIAPRLIEDALLRLEGIVGAVAFSVPDEHHGEVPAAIVLTEGRHRLDTGAIDERALRQDLLPHLHHRHVPVGVSRVDRLPLGRTGKPDRLAAARFFLETWPRVEPTDPTADGADGDDDDGAGPIATAWADLFGRTIKVDERFGDLGGDSLLAHALVMHYEEANIPLTILDIAASVTIRSHAALLARILG